MKFDLKDAKFGKYDLEKIKKLFKELEFFSLINRLGEISGGTAEKIDETDKRRRYTRR